MSSWPDLFRPSTPDVGANSDVDARDIDERSDAVLRTAMRRHDEVERAAVKVCMFHLMPYRDLPADFAKRYKSAYIDPVWFDVADPQKVGQYYNWTLDEFIHAARLGINGVCTNQHHQNVYGFMANPSLMGSVLARATNGQDVAIIQLGSTLAVDQPADAHRRRIRHARLHQRRPAGRRLPDRLADRCHDLQRRRAGRAARALPRSAGAGVESLAGEGGVCLERQALSAADGQPVAAADPAAASADLDSRLRQRHDGRVRDRSRRRFLSPQLSRRPRTPTRSATISGKRR